MDVPPDAFVASSEDCNDVPSDEVYSFVSVESALLLMVLASVVAVVDCSVISSWLVVVRTVDGVVVTTVVVVVDATVVWSASK